MTRELREHARRPFTYWTRVLVAGALPLGCFWLVADLLTRPGMGGELFRRIHFALYCAVWVLVPIAASDCLSRERREGTLALLFLTPLKPVALVLAKVGAHAVQLMAALLAVAPVLMIPILLGGTNWLLVAWTVLVLANVAGWSLGLTVVASSVSRGSNRALTLAVVLESAGFVLFPWMVGALLGINSLSTWQQGYSQASYDFFTGFSLLATPGDDFVRATPLLFKPTQVIYVASTMTVISTAVFIFSLLFAGNRLRRNWRDTPASRVTQKMEQTFCRPIVGTKLLRRWMRRLLERNPLGWLERRQWSGRLVIWTWLAVVGSVYGFMLNNLQFFRRVAFVDQILAGLLLFSLATVAAGSFRRERETGVLELLLVSPLRVRQIINGRLLGIWGQFLPAIGLLLGIWLYLGSDWQGQTSPAPVGMGSLIVLYAVLPVAGLYFSLQCRSYLLALLLTLSSVLLLPDLLVGLLTLLTYAHQLDTVTERQLVTLIQIGVAGELYRSLHRKLEHRQFPILRNAR